MNGGGPLLGAARILRTLLIWSLLTKRVRAGDDDDDEGLLSKKTLVILIILAICVLIAVCINFINVHSDFEDLKDFYRGYMGRRLLITEGRLTSRAFLGEISRKREPSPPRFFQNGFLQNTPTEAQDGFLNEDYNRLSVITCEDQIHDIASYQDMDVTSLTTTTTQLFSSSSKTASNFPNAQAQKTDLNGRVVSMQETDIEEEDDDGFDETSALRQVVDDLLKDESEKRLLSSQWGVMRPENFPINVSFFIEDHDPEWRDLDYSTDIGEVPTSFSEFIVQYDCRCFGNSLSEAESGHRKKLYHQFRKWKKRRRKLWNVVVTERAKKEMADQEKGGGRGNRGGTEAR